MYSDNGIILPGSLCSPKIGVRIPGSLQLHVHRRGAGSITIYDYDYG